jgi:CRP-like cAMP-binding protein
MPATQPQLSKWKGTVRKAKLFDGLGEVEFSALLGEASSRSRSDGSFFFMQGDPADNSYVLVSGKVRLSQLNPDGQGVILGYIGPGREFGIIAAVNAAHYPVSAQAVGESVAIYWSKQTIQRLMDRNPEIQRNALQIMARQIAEFQTRIRELSTQRVENRIARTLLRLSRQSGQEIESGILIDLPLTRQDIAEMTGTTLYTVSRTLRHWEAQGVIRSRRSQVIIRSPDRLKEIAEG